MNPYLGFVFIHLGQRKEAQLSCGIRNCGGAGPSGLRRDKSQTVFGLCAEAK